MQAQPLHTFGTQKQILFDDYLVEEKRGFTLTMNPAMRTEDPAIVPDKPWEAKGTTHSSVITGVKDVHELWYYAPDLDGNGRPEVVLMPHLGSATLESRQDMGDRVIANIMTFQNGHRPPDRVIPAML